MVTLLSAKAYLAGDLGAFTWAWGALLLLGAWHGVNPAMGWLFAVALGMQKKSRNAVWQSLLPIAAGHAAAIGLVVGVAVVAHAALPSKYLKIAVVCILFAFGLYRLLGKGHSRWGGMQVGFRDLSIWSFLMASAHGAGLMLLPVLLGMSATSDSSPAASAVHVHTAAFTGFSMGAWTGLIAVALHTLGYLLATGAVAFLIYEKFGLSLLRKAWLNLDLVWAVALMATACFALLIPA
jgi:hypothetical protein